MEASTADGRTDLSGVELTLVDSIDDVFNFREWLSRPRDRLAFDLETSGSNLGRDRVRLAQIGDRDRGWAFPCEGANSWYGAFAESMRGYCGAIYAHNLIFDSSFTKRDGIEVPQAQANCTMVQAQLHNSSLPIGLKPTAKRLVDRRAVAGQKMLDEAKRKQKWGWDTTPVDFPAYWMYGALDPVLTCRIAEKIEPKVKERYSRPYELELGAIHVLREAQLSGMRVDLDYCQLMSSHLEAEMAALAPRLPDLPGRPGQKVNPNAPAQVVEWLQSRGARLTKKTDKGKLAADDEVVSYWEKNGIPECRFIKEYRKADKLKNTYFDTMLELNEGGVVHPSIRVLGAQKTGRMSVSAPALQTLPKTAVGRNAFLAREGHCLIMADFSGIEMRILAHMANVPKMIELYEQGIDVHTWTAQQIYRKEHVSKAERAVAKTGGFGKVYGSGVPKFALATGLSEPDAQAFIDSYDALFPEVKQFQENVALEVRGSRQGDKRWGQVHTEFGRRLFCEKEEAYKGVNYRIQGSAGEILKLKLIELSNVGLTDFIRLPIHDEIVFEVPDEDVHDVVGTINEVMPEREIFRVPLEVEVEVARRWGDVYD